jgi:hypothetical protein
MTVHELYFNAPRSFGFKPKFGFPTNDHLNFFHILAMRFVITNVLN